MTFIATIKAKKGVAIIADSLVTTTTKVLRSEKFLELLGTKQQGSGDAPITFDANEIVSLFESRKSHTKDYEEKLFKFGKYAAITTTGAAAINGKRIDEVVQAATPPLIKKGKTQKPIEEVNVDFKTAIAEEIAEHLTKFNEISSATVFYLTHYIVSERKTRIFKLTVQVCEKAAYDAAPDDFLTLIEMHEGLPVICDGQNRMADRILYGDMNSTWTLIPKVIEKVVSDFGIAADQIPPDYAAKMLQDQSIVPSLNIDDIKFFKLTNLSLQQAVDLGWLLMKIEKDFQKYTEEIPTVGGVIKVAVIDEGGFRFVSGDKIEVKDVY